LDGMRCLDGGGGRVRGQRARVVAGSLGFDSCSEKVAQEPSY